MRFGIQWFVGTIVEVSRNDLLVTWLFEGEQVRVQLLACHRQRAMHINKYHSLNERNGHVDSNAFDRVQQPVH